MRYIKIQQILQSVIEAYLNKWVDILYIIAPTKDNQVYFFKILVILKECLKAEDFEKIIQSL